MRRLIAVGVILTVTAILCVLSNTAINRKYNTLCLIIFEAEQSVEREDFNTAEQKAEQLETEWTNSEKILSLFLKRDEIGRIGSEIAALSSLANENSSDVFLGSCASIKVALTHIQKGEKFGILSIL